MKRFFTFYIFSLVLLDQFFGATGFGDATAPGDIIIGGLFPIHESVKEVNGTWICDRFSTARLVQSLIMVHAVEEVNKRQVLGNLTLGYRIVDSCSDVTTSLKKALSFMRKNNTRCVAEQPSPPVLAVVGGYHSEISIAVTRLLNLENIPQISYGATSGFLSDKTRFPSFMRTVPEDDHQVRAILNILKNHQWTWVGIVTTDGDYGRYAVQRLQQHAKGTNICFAFTSVLPDVLGDSQLQDSISATVKSITENENVSVIVSFAKPNHMMYLFNHLLKEPKGKGKVWVASDNWSQSPSILSGKTLSEVGTIFGTTLKSGNSTTFEQYLKNVDVDPEHHRNNAFLYQFLKNQTQQGKRAKPGTANDTAIETLINMIYPYAVFSVELAVEAIAQAVANLCIERDCKTRERLQPSEVNTLTHTYTFFQLRDALRKGTFTMDGENYTFNENGDLNSGYDIILWNQKSTTLVDVHNIVATYSIKKNHTLTFISPEKEQEVFSVTGDVISSCSNKCAPGTRKQSAQGQPVCCYECIPCPENYFSNTSDSIDCYHCNRTQYSPMGSKTCIPKEIIFLRWNDKYHDTLLAFTALGALLTLVVGIIFIARWNTPVVRASVGPICILLLFSLLSTFVSVILFGGKPKDELCQARQVLFGLSFTLCVSCIMVKSFKIILAFEFDPSIKRVLKKLYKPYIIIAVCLSGQVIICALWLTLKSPKTKWDVLENTKRLLSCDEKSYSAFGAMLCYIGVLCLICFGVAFKGRKLPHSYNESKFITFAMLIYFICWIIFGPVYVSVKGKYLPAVEMVVILISAYGILFCQFFTKCYVILFKKEANTERAFRQDVRNHSLGSISEMNSYSVTSIGIQNPAFDVELPMSNSMSFVPLTNQNPSMGSDQSSLSLSPVSNLQLTRLQNDDRFNKKHLKRYSSLPAVICKS
ncbi:G-protein coupled receptor family C group 6 member A-like [Morone saxatilis]|uniref:G-protein coupled receptor family C group 6 member A-like n=1 Tax=Morone saxatilis TaxID=34816 RepID=UPI0015E1E9FC|nr:G-protein coupled receptor family C group 6 member A-like [Morone saxatilis]